MLKTKNYFTEIKDIDWASMPEALSKGHNLVVGASQNNWSAYNYNENIKRVVDAFISKLDEYLKKSGKLKTEKSLPEKTVRATKPKEKPAVQPKPKPSAKHEIDEDEDEDNATPIERIDTDVQFIKRYAAMHGKVKTQAQVLNLLTGLQKAILERRIRKESPYAKEINLMQEQLIKAYEKMDDMAEIKIDAKNLKRYLEIAGSQENMLSISLLKAYVSLNGKKGIKDKAEKIIERMTSAVKKGKIQKNDKYAKKLNDAYETLKTFVGGNSDTMKISRAELNGLMGIVGDDLFAQKKSLDGFDEDHDDENSIVVPSRELLQMEFETIGLKGKYKDLIGDPSVGFSAMVYGLPKSGKSTLCLDFAKYLAEHHGKVLFCAVEEGFGYTLKEKIERLNASHPNLYITDRIPSDLSSYQFVFIDSVSKAGMDVSDLEELRKQYPGVSFIFIYHTTKEGRFKGVNTHAHEVDVIIEVGKGEAKATGRFNAGGKMNTT
ncbi:MAG: AAA family ATPase [Bacteroidetes bacterium]|nr:AAA family ATPase [Bacteroidota bacterium]